MKKNSFKWLFLLLQIGLAVYFGVGQCDRIIYSTQGLSLVMFSGFFISMFINLFLSFRIQNLGGKKDWFIIIVYFVWTVVVIFIIVFMLYYGILKTLDFKLEMLMLLGILFGVVMLFFIVKKQQWTLIHPYTRGGISTLFKSFPQIMLIPIAINNGVAGWDPGTIWVGHITILIRILLLVISISKNKEKTNKENYAILFSELFNSFSWIAFTLVYYTLV